MQLSNNFYSKIWNDDDTPSSFRDKFFSRSSSDKIQAFRQYDWFSEVFGGPSFRDDEARQRVLLPKVMAQHTSSRTTMEHAVTWLKLMQASIQEEFPDHPQLREALGLYWLHFYAFFPSFNDNDRRAFRRLIQ
jgi:truncated hemoglobin YjbI